jgi:hypothetical protein
MRRAAAGVGQRAVIPVLDDAALHGSVLPFSLGLLLHEAAQRRRNRTQQLIISQIIEGDDEWNDEQRAHLICEDDGADADAGSFENGVAAARLYCVFGEPHELCSHEHDVEYRLADLRVPARSVWAKYECRWWVEAGAHTSG